MVSAVKAFLGELRLVPIDVDSTDEVGAFHIEVEGHRDYKRYLHRYVKNEELIYKATWKIVSGAVLKDLVRAFRRFFITDFQ